MKLPFQAAPVYRYNACTPGYSSIEEGVNPAVNWGKLFNRGDTNPGTCTCTSLPWANDIYPFYYGCNPGFSPQCDQNGGCICNVSSQVTNNGRVPKN